MPGPPQCARHHQSPAANGVLLLADMLASGMREAVTYGCVTASRHSRRYWSRLYPADRHSHQRLRSLCRLCNRSTRKHGSHLCPVFLRAVDIRNQLQSVRRVTRSISNRCLVQFLTNKARLDIVGAGRLDRCSRDHHAGRCAGAISIQRNNRRASDHSIVRSLVGELRICTAGARRWLGEPDLCNNFVWLQRSLEQILEEIISLNSAYAIRPFRHNIGPQCQHHTRRIGSGIRVSNAAAESAPVTHLLVSDHRRSLGQQGEIVLDDIRTLNVHIPRHRTYSARSILLPDIERPLTLPRSIRCPGCARRNFIVGNRLCPPASNLASSPYCCRSAIASSTVVAGW